jgi:hypothetical protein
VKRDVDRAIAFGSVAAVAIVPTIMLVGIGVGGGFNGGTTGGPIIPAAGEAPGPGPDVVTPSPTLTMVPKGPAAATGGTNSGLGTKPGGFKPSPDTGGSRSFIRVTDRSLYWINGTGSYSEEKAKITMSPFSFDATTTTKATAQRRTTTDVVRVTLVGKVQTTVQNGIQTDRRTLTDPQYADFVKSSDPKELTTYARSFAMLQRQKGIHFMKFDQPAGPQGFETDTLNYNLRALMPYMPKTISDALDKTPVPLEGLTGLLVADKWNRPWAFGVAKIALPLGMANVGILFLGYQR